MENVGSWRFWGAVLFLIVFAMAGLWRLLLFWPRGGLGSGLKGGKKKVFWTVFIMSLGAWVFFLYWEYCVSGEFPWF